MTSRVLNPMSAAFRLVLCLLLGLAAVAVFVSAGYGRFAPLGGWDVAAVSYITLVFGAVFGFDQRTTKTHAMRENPGRVLSDTLLLVASLASLFAVGLLVVQSAHETSTGRTVAIAVGLVSVIVSWAVVHTTFMLNYARQYYGEPEGGVAFGKELPTYVDFAYLAFTVGMTFQLSDTTVETSALRRTVLKHALLSYVFGTAVIAATINLLAGLGK